MPDHVYKTKTFKIRTDLSTSDLDLQPVAFWITRIHFSYLVFLDCCKPRYSHKYLPSDLDPVTQDVYVLNNNLKQYDFYIWSFYVFVTNPCAATNTYLVTFTVNHNARWINTLLIASSEIKATYIRLFSSSNKS